jgi:hypothetical protein
MAIYATPTPFKFRAMVFAVTLRVVVLWAPLLTVWSPVRPGAVLASITDIHILALIFLSGVLIVTQLSSHNEQNLCTTCVKQVAFVMRHVLGTSYELSVRLVAGWSCLLGRTVCVTAGSCVVLRLIWASTPLQLLLARGAVCMQAAGLSSWPGRPPGFAKCAAAPASAPATSLSPRECTERTAARQPVHRRTPGHLQHATTGRCNLYLASCCYILIASVAFATFLCSGEQSGGWNFASVCASSTSAFASASASACGCDCSGTCACTRASGPSTCAVR